MFKYEITTAATGEPVDSTDLREHLRVTTTGEADYIDSLGVAARQRVEEYTNRQLMPVTSFVYFDQFPSSEKIDLPWAPLRGISDTGVVFTDSSGNTTTMASSDYTAETKGNPGALSLTFHGEWPTDTLASVNPIQVEMTNGYATQSAIPEALKLGIKMFVADLYEQRENFVVGQSVVAIPDTVQNILMPYRLFTF